MNILVLVEHTHTSIAPATWHVLGAARLLQEITKAPIHILMAGHQCESLAHKLAKDCGAGGHVEKILLADSECYAHFLAENMAALIHDYINQNKGSYGYVLAPASTFGKNILPRACALADTPQISDVLAIESAEDFIRPIYAGNALAHVRLTELLKYITIRTSAFEAYCPAPQSDPQNESDSPCLVETLPYTPEASQSRFVKTQSPDSARPSLDSARVVVSGGRGVGSAEDFALIETLADRLGGAVGASRAAVDAGYVPNDYQVGQTGKIVAPDLYIAVGISGAIQHLAGMKGSKTIVAINKDPDAPIFEVADYGLVADLFEAVPELIEKI